MTSDPFKKLTKFSVTKLTEILSGEDGKRVSIRAATRAVNINRTEFNAWVERSRERRPADPSWLWALAKAADRAAENQGQVLEDKLWERALNGVEEPVYQGGMRVGYKTKYDHNLALKLLAARDPKYRSSFREDDMAPVLDTNELYRRMDALWKLREADKAAEREAKAAVDRARHAKSPDHRE